MSDSNQPPESGYNQFYKAGPGAPSSAAPEPMSARPLGGNSFKKKVRSPMVATGALLLVGVAFAALIMGSYPDSTDDNGSVPIVQASAERFKVTPDERGGAEIAYRESTIFGSVSGNPMDVNAPMENLLDQDEVAVEKMAVLGELAAREALRAEQQEAVDIASAKNTSLENLLEPVSSRKDVASPMMKESVEKISPQEVIAAAKVDFVEKQTPQKSQPKTLHVPAGSPETLAFVRSVLDKQGNGGSASVSADSARRAAAVQPAAGDASADIVPEGEGFFVQLGSIRSIDRAAGEWTRLKKAFGSDLNNAEYRVKSADLGERGTFYRIQAGPYTKTHATSVCESIKMQKPGACLVVR